MDKTVLHEKVRNFIGGNQELLNWFKRFIQMDTSAEEMMNLPQTMNKVRLSVCRALGPSYRLLPKLVSSPFLPCR
jgi:paired amphipathic helix protein Sin3a